MGPNAIRGGRGELWVPTAGVDEAGLFIALKTQMILV